MSNIHLAQLHSPITKIDTVAKDVMVEEVDYQDGVIFFCAKGSPIGFHELTTDQSLISYGVDWEKISSLCINNDKLYAAHQKGVEEVSLVNLGTVRVSSAGGEEWLMPHTLAPYGDGIVVSDPEKHCVLKWSSSV